MSSDEFEIADIIIDCSDPFRVASFWAELLGRPIAGEKGPYVWLGAATHGVVSIIAAGERWSDGSFRPCLEDMLGAGAFLSRLPTSDLSPEALAAATTFEAARPDLGSRLMQCGSGRELIAKGFVDDVVMAAQLDSSQACPVLRDGAYVNG